MRLRQCEDTKDVRMTDIESLLKQLLSLLAPSSSQEGQVMNTIKQKIESFEVKLDQVLLNQEDIKKELCRLNMLSNEASSSDSMCSLEDSVCEQKVSPDPRLIARGRQGVVVVTDIDRSPVDCDLIQSQCSDQFTVTSVQGDVCDSDPGRQEVLIENLPQDIDFVLLQPTLAEGGGGSEVGEVPVLASKIAAARPRCRVYLGCLPPRYDSPKMNQWVEASNDLMTVVADLLGEGSRLGLTMVSQSRLACPAGSRRRGERYLEGGELLSHHGRYLFNSNIAAVVGSSRFGDSPVPRRLKVSRLQSRGQLIRQFRTKKISI